ncbi:MAG: histidine phosphatase family protein [Ruminococcaceae bacterium]|nr:histidine phosphatase family protein [Oscillospiraceae bacterium]
MKLLVIRHGQSEADVLNVHEGRADFPLTSLGLRQAAAAAEYISRHYTLSRIYSSTLTRARQTAEQISAACGVPVTAEDMLMEFNNGLIAGLDRETAAKRYPRPERLPIHDAVHGQESALEFRFRADVMLSRLLSENDPDAVVAVVSHGGMITQLYRSFLRLPADSDIWFATGDTGIHEWMVSDDRRLVVRANFTAHTDGLGE